MNTPVNWSDFDTGTRFRTRVADSVGLSALLAIAFLGIISFARVREIIAGIYQTAASQVIARFSGAPPRPVDKETAGALQQFFETKITEVEEARRELINSADLARIHHEVHAAVGEENWETFVKPDFLKELYVRTARDYRIASPTWQDIVRWVRAHPAESNRLLASYKPTRPPAK